VYLNNPDDIREAFSKPEFSGRTGANFMLDKDCDEFNSGIVFSQGRKWLDHRRFTLRTLRDFGFAKRTSEGIILEEAKDLIRRLKKMEGKPISTQNFFNASTLNVIWSIVAGERYDPDDIAMEKLMKLLADYFDTFFVGIRAFYALFPALLKLKNTFPILFRSQSDKFRDELFAFLKTTVDNHRKTMQLGQPRDYIDALLEESSNIEGFEEIDMQTTLMDFFVAGSESTASALVWAFFVLAQRPEVQEKFATEIQSVVGHREVTLSDKLRLPYVEATITEIMRLSTIAPFGAPHGTTCDVVFKGFFFPKKTVVLPNIYACLMSPDIWGDPQVFRPERFLSSDGKTVVRNKAWIPFGVGKRFCLGESLARDEIFLFLTNLIQNLRVTMPEDEPLHSLEGHLGGTMIPEPHRVIVCSRY
jgi:cytochrome P450